MEFTEEEYNIIRQAMILYHHFMEKEFRKFYFAVEYDPLVDIRELKNKLNATPRKDED